MGVFQITVGWPQVLFQFPSCNVFFLRQADWQSLRHDFPVLNAAQLHKILTEYQVGAGKSRPAEWRPTADEVDAALKDGKM